MIHALIIRGLLALMTITHDVEAVLYGTPAPEASFSFAVALITSENAIVFCTGAIISDFHVLTAAHCVRGEQLESYFVIAGLTDIRYAREKNLYRVVKVNLHPDYLPAVPKLCSIVSSSQPEKTTVLQLPLNDIAIIEVNRTFNFIEEPMSKVVLPQHPPEPFSNCLFAGWGRSIPEQPTVRNLLYTEMSIASIPDCTFKRCLVRIWPGIFCAIDPLGKSTPDAGDSGGALVCNNRVVGVATGGHRDPTTCCSFTNVYNFLPFINSILNPDCSP